MDWSRLAGVTDGIDVSSLIAIAGIDTVFECIWCAKFYPSVLQFQHPSYVKIPIGQHLTANVEEYSISRRRLNFFDMLGISVVSRLIIRAGVHGHITDKGLRIPNCTAITR